MLLTVLLWLPGCSSIKLGYNNAPELTYWWLDSYLDFDQAQSRQVRAELATLQAWHRANELPAYVRTLEKLQRAALANVTPEQACSLYTELKSHAQTLIERIVPIAATVGTTLKSEQIDHLARQLDKRRQKWREEWLEGTPGEQQARRLKKRIERADSLYGRLDEPQLAQLKAGMATSAFNAELIMRESLRRHQETLQTLRQILNGQLTALQARTPVQTLLEHTLNSPDEAYQHYETQTTQENCQALATLHNSMTPSQRLKALETLKDYETDVRTLMAARR